jgi:hypothetical protein
MSALPIPEPDLAPAESRTWYPVNLELEYKLWYRRKLVRCGSGRTVRMSSCAVQFKADVALPAGRTITIDMNWPCLLDGKCALKLQMFGRVLSNSGSQNVVRFIRYEFRTVGMKSLLPPKSLSCIRDPAAISY